MRIRFVENRKFVIPCLHHFRFLAERETTVSSILFRRDSCKCGSVVYTDINPIAIYLHLAHSENPYFSSVVKSTRKLRFEINRYNVNVSRVTSEI